MKRVVVFLITMVLISASIFAQNRNQRFNRGDNLTPDEFATLQSKRLTLYLDLTDKQQKEVYKLKKQQAEERQKYVETYRQKRQAGEALSKQDRFNYRNSRLDRQLETKAAMQKILNKEQFEKWQTYVKQNVRQSKRDFRKNRVPRNIDKTRQYKNRF